MSGTSQDATMRKRPKIAFVTAQYDHVVSGPGTFASYLRRAVQHDELDVTFFSADIERKQQDYERPVKSAHLPPPFGHLLRQWAYHRAFTSAHRNSPFDLLWYNSSYDGLASSLFKPNIPLVVMVNDYSKAITTDLSQSQQIFGWERTLKNRFWREFENFVLHRADIVIVNSKYMQREMQVHYGLLANRLRLLYKGVDLKLFGGAREQTPFESDTVRVLFVKNDYRRGGLADLLKALAELNFSTSLTVIGAPETEYEVVRTLAADVGYSGRLHLQGGLTREQVAAEFKRHDLFCVPSRSEALGVVFMEALASGIPTIGTQVGGIPEVLDDGRAGWLVAPSNPVELRNCLVQVKADVEERQRKVDYGIQYVRNFSVEKMVERMNALAEEIILQTMRQTVRTLG